MDDTKYLALINSGGTAVHHCHHICTQQLGLEIHHLNKTLKLEATGGDNIPYMGYVEVNLKILEMKGIQ